jgi:hyperosmotically inducible periplasmic protein
MSAIGSEDDISTRNRPAAVTHHTLHRILILALALLAAALLNGCTMAVVTMYQLAVDERKIGTYVDDKNIEAAIAAKFQEDERVRPLELSAFSYNGRVFLVGQYDSTKQKARAVKIARETPGVKSVTAHVLPRRALSKCGNIDTAALEVRVKGHLIADEHIRATNVKVESLQCNIILLGIVETRREARQAVACAKNVEGVRSVTSYLKSTQ